MLAPRLRAVWNVGLLLGLAWSTMGCAGRIHAGYVKSVTREGSDAGLQGSVHANLFGLGGAARGKIGPNLFSLAVGPELGLQALPEFNGPISPSFSGGIHLLQLDVAQKQFSFGMGSPFMMLGINVCDLERRQNQPDEIWCLSVNGNMDHHIRFGHENETFLGVSLGLTRRTGSY